MPKNLGTSCGMIIVLAGHSGVGKTTLLNRFLTEHQGWYYPRSVTTRLKRGDSNDSEYTYVTVETFKEWMGADRFFEHTEYNGNFYGTLKSDLDHERVMIIADIYGALELKKAGAATIFITTDNYEVLRERMEKRGDSLEAIEKRMDRIQKDKKFIPQFDYLLMNRVHDFSETYKRLLAIIIAEGCRV